MLPGATKELIKAMILTQGQADSRSNDFIAGKGEALVMLLHGGPGTGKTLTAGMLNRREDSLSNAICNMITPLMKRQTERY